MKVIYAMARRKKKSNEVKGCVYFAVVLIILFMCAVSRCTQNSVSSKMQTTTSESNGFVDRTPPPPTETRMSGKEAMDATRWMRHTVVQETLERKRIESTMTEIVKRTERPTEWYLATVDAIKTRAVQQATMEVLMTEAANK